MRIPPAATKLISAWRALRCTSAPPMPVLQMDDWQAIRAWMRRGAATSRSGRRAPGEWSSLQRGPGQHDLQTRLYVRGDDLRRMHWRQLARSGQAHVLEQRQEHAADWHGLLDLRGALLFGTRGRPRAVQGARALLLDAACQVQRHPDAHLRWTLWRSDGPHGFDGGTGAGGLRRLADWLLAQPLPVPDPGSAVDPAQLCAWLVRLQHAGSNHRLVLCSSSLDTTMLQQPLRQALWRLGSTRELLVVLPRDVAELRMPDLPTLDVIELEGGNSGSLNPHQARLLTQRASQAHAAVAQQLRHCGARVLQPDSRDDLPVLLGLLRPSHLR